MKDFIFVSLLLALLNFARGEVYFEEKFDDGEL